MDKRITVTVAGVSYYNVNDAPGWTATERQWRVWFKEIKDQIEHARQIADFMEAQEAKTRSEN